MNPVRALGWLVICSLLGAGNVSAGVLVLTPEHDNTLFEDANGDTSNGSGPALFAGRTSQGRIRRGLLLFDPSVALPRETKIDSVVLTLRVSNAPNTVPRQFSLHLVSREWGEGTSFSSGGAGDNAMPNDATWTQALYPTDSWISPGGDFDPVASASSIVQGTGAYTWSGAAMTADVQSWMARSDANHGWLLRGEENDDGTARRFDSREAAETSRPTLTIYYTDAMGRPMSWGGIKARYR
jgi:hypothetical protein